MGRREKGEIQPGIRWGPFTLRVPLIHARLEWPELVQGLLVAGATGLAIVPLYIDHFGMDFETAVALVVVQSIILCASPILFGEPFCPGWLTPALPLVLAEALSYDTIDERIQFVTAVILIVGGIFLLFGASGLGRLFMRWVPEGLKAGIILGAGMSAIFQEFVPQSGGRPPRVEEFSGSILVAVGITLLLLFSMPVDRLKRRMRWLATLAGLGLAPGFFVAMLLGPIVGEVDYSEFFSLFVGADGSWALGPREFIFLPDFATLWKVYSPLARGFPDAQHFAGALPLALAAYIIGFGDIVTGTEIVRAASAGRDDEEIPFDENRTHVSLGIRNLAQGLVAGPFFPLQGPLWTGAMVVVAERYRRGRAAMDSLYSGIFSYYVLGLPIFFFCAPFIALYRPVLPIALSLTLLITGFACAYVALAIPRNRIERGLAVAMGLVIMKYSTGLGLLVGILLTVFLLGRDAWRKPVEV